MVACGVLLEIYPESYNILNSYNSTKYTLYITETCLKDLHINASEGGQIHMNKGDGVGELWRCRVYDATLSTLHCRRGKISCCS